MIRATLGPLNWDVVNHESSYIIILGLPQSKYHPKIELKQTELGCQVMSRCHLDVHWQPYFANCCFCRIPFKYFVRMEELDKDVKFIGKLANIDFNTKIERNVRVGDKIGTKTDEYFSQLDVETFEKIYNLYKVDFEMFNYSYNFNPS